MASIFDWSSTASSNTTCDGLNTNTGMTPANVDNVFRSIMAIVRQTFASALQNFLAGTAALPIANGGTGATTAPAALTALNALDASYRDLALNLKSASFTLADADRGKAYLYTGSATAAATLNPQSTTAITSGATYVIRNGGTASVTITRGAGVVLQANGSTTSADAVLAPGGVATVIYWSGDIWSVSGSGLS